MRFVVFGLIGILSVCATAGGALAQDAGSTAPVSFCDPLLDTTVEERDGDEEELVKTVRYDLEVAALLATDQEIVDTLFEERWDTSSGAASERAAFCPAEPSYLINWTQVMGLSDAGRPAPVAQGYMSLRKDGTFRFTYEKRPYEGSWTLAGGKITLSAPWLNGGTPVETQVERVTTPVEWVRPGEEPVTVEEVVYRIGAFRLLPVQTTVKGADQACLCGN